MTEAYSNEALLAIRFEELTEEKVVDIFQHQIQQMAAGKYRTMSCKAAGGDPEDLVSDLNCTLILAYRDCQKRVLERQKNEDETAFNLTGLDAAKFISCRLRNRCLDLARIQRDHIEPGDYELPEDKVNITGNDTYRDASLRMWRVMLTPLQEQIMVIWENNNFEMRKEPVKALVRNSVKLLKVKPAVIEEAIYSMPAPPFNL